MKALLIAPSSAPGLDPLAYASPPALLPLLGAPLSAPLLQSLARGGVTDVVLACRARSAAYDRFLLDGRPWGLNLATLEAADADSTLLVLKSVRDLGFHDQTLAVMPANCWTDVDWSQLESAHCQTGGGVSAVTADSVSTSILLIDPGVAFSPGGARPLTADLRWRPITNWREYWRLASEAMSDPSLGVAPRYASTGGQVHMAPLARMGRDRCSVAGPVWLGPGAIVDPGATLRGPVWIGPHCRVGPGVTLDSCAIENGAYLHGPLELRNVLVVGNRAITMDRGEVEVLDEASAPEVDRAMTAGLLNLATSTARRTAPVLDILR